MKVTYRARALADLEAIFSYLNERSPTGARNVLRALADAIDAIADAPLAATKSSDPDVRVKILKRYRYKIFYSVTADEIEIVHIRHGARRPWL
jgi:plasmid stabilization system protein ParE